MSWSLKPRAAVVLPLLALVALSVLIVSVLYSQTPPVTVVSVGSEPRGLAISLTTNRAVVTNHNTNTVTVANLTTFSTTTVTVGSHPWGVAINGTTNKAYIANEQSDTVSVVNLATNAVTATIAVGDSPKEIAVNSSTNIGVVANTKSDTVSILDLATNTVNKTLAVGVDPQGVVVNASTNKAYVTNAGSDTVSVVNLATKTVSATVAVGAGPTGIDINRGTQRLVVTNRLAGTVTILNTSTNAVVATVTVGEGPADVAINTSTNRAYVTNTLSDSVSVINLANNTVIATYPVGQNPDGVAVIPLLRLLLVVNVRGDTVYAINVNNPPGGTAVPVGRDPEGVAIDLDTNTAVTANAKSNDLSVVDLGTASELTRIPVGKSPRDVAIHPTSHLLVAANFRANTASIVDLPTRAVVETVPVGKGPRSVAIDPTLNVAVVANERANTLSLINLSTRAVTATLSAGSHPTDLAINPNTHVAIVANKKTDQVTLIDLVNRVTIGAIAVGKDPVSVAINPVTNTAVVANEKAGTLSVINLATHTVTATLAVLPTPTGVAINPSTNVAVVVGHETNTVVLVDLATNAIQATFPAGREPQQVAINPSTNSAAITNEEPGALTILQLPNPVPIVNMLAPAAVSAGGPGFTLTLNGSRFLKTSTVHVGTQTLPTQFVSNEQLRADVPASAITTAGPVAVTVTNPSPGGGTSNTLTFTVVSADTTAPNVSINTPPSGATTNQLTATVTGTVDDLSATVRVNGVVTPLSGGSFTTTVTLAEGSNTITVTATDAAGNVGTASVTVILDTMPPTISASVSPLPNAAGWNKANVTVSFGCSETGSGIASCPAPVTVNTEAADQVISGTATDLAGNTASTSVTVNLDLTPPIITPSVVPAPNAAGWNRTDPTVTFTCLDDLSGIATCPVSQTVTAEGAGQDISIAAEDAAGNPATISVTISLDKTPPVLTVAAPADGQFVAASPVTVLGTVSDALSPPTITVNGTAVPIAPTGAWSGEAAIGPGPSALVTIVSSDPAGNQTTATRTVTLDHTAPVVTLTDPAAGLATNRSPVEVRGAIADDGQIAQVELTCAGVTQTLAGQPGPFVGACPLTGDGPKGLVVVAVDAAGNRGTAERRIVYDTTPPGLTVTSPTDGLFTNNPSVSLTGTLDDPSASLLVTGQPAAASAAWQADRLLAEGPQTVDVVATDPAGNATTVTRAVTVDTAPPVIALDGQDRAVTATPSYALSGTINEPVAAVTVNGAPAALTGARFDAAVSLTEGDNLLTVTATDPAGNAATTIRNIILDTVPPPLTVTTPEPGRLTNSRTMLVAGTVDDPGATVTVNGQPATVTGTSWAASASLTEGDNTLTIRAVDAVGNSATRDIAVVVDSVPPIVEATAPADVGASENVTVSGTADDAGGLVRLTLAIGNVTIADAVIAGAQASRQGAYTIPVTAAVGDALALAVTAVDRAGNVGTATATLHVTAAATLPGFIQGDVFDDSLGLPLAGASALVNGVGAPVADNGAFLLTQPASDVVVRVTKPGYTAVERTGRVQAGRRLTLLDARLTPVDPTEMMLDATGGVAPSPSSPIRLDVPAGALGTPTGVRVTPLSRQGLVLPLPLGWTPIAAAQIDATATWTAAAALAVSRSVPSTAAATVVRYDEATHRWLVIGSAQWTASTLAIEIAGPGQYAMILPDVGPTAPPVPIVAQPLAGVPAVNYPGGTAGTGTVVPRAAPPTKDGPVQPAAQGTVTLTSPTPLPSGMVVTAAVSERFDPRQGETVVGSGFREDVILYATADNGTAGNLTATFPITPSRRYSLSELLLGTITLDLRTPEGEVPATVVGSGGATLTTPEGAYVAIPAAALTAEVPVVFTMLPAPSIPVPTGWRALATVTLDLPQVSLAASATLTVPTPSTYQPGTQVLVAQVVPIAGAQRMRLAAVGRVDGGLLTTETQVGGISLAGIRQGGEYVILQPPAPVGFVTGVVRGSDQAARAGVVVEVATLPLVDQTEADGRFVVAAVVGSNTVSAQDATTAESATATVDVTQRDAVVVHDLGLAVVPFAVTAIEPADNATGVSIRAVLHVTFNRPVDTATLTPATLSFRDGTTEIGVLAIPSADGTRLTLYPRALEGNRHYTLTLGTGINDRFGRNLPATVTASFTTANVVPPPRPAAGRLSVSFPTDDGMITITATQGTVDPVHTVVVLNLATGETVSVTVLADGSFSAQIFGSIGDELQLLIRDVDGNQTVADLPPMRATDGRTFVSTTGGEVRGPDNSRLLIPPQALKVPAVFTLTPAPLANPNAPLPAPLPDGLVQVGAWRITSQGIPWRVEATLAVPKPSTFPAGAHPFVVKSLPLPDGTMRWAMITTAKVVGNEIVTASPPFPGVTSEGLYAVVAYPASVQTIVVSGIVFRDANSNGVYDGGDVAAAGAFVGEGSFTGFATAPSPLAVAQTDGTYALLLSAPTGSTTFTSTVTALDHRGSLSRTETLPAIDPSTTSALAANLLLEDLTVSRQQDQAPPTLAITAKGPDLFAGTSLINSPLTLNLVAQDDQVVASLALTRDGVVQTVAPQGLGTAKSTAEFVLIPTDPGLVTFVATVEDLTGKRAQQHLTIRIVTASDLRQLPPPIPNTPPTVVTAGISPPDGATDLTIDTVVRVPFSEPVQATATSLFLRNRTTGETVETEIGGTGAEVILTPRGYLHYGATYDVVLTDQLTDGEGKALANPLSVSFSTMPLGVLSRTPLMNGRGLHLDGTTLIGLEQNQGLVTLDVSEPGAPTELGRLDLLGQTNNGFAVAQEAVVVAHKYGTQTFGTGPLSMDTFDAGLAAGTFGGSSGFGVDVSSSVSASALFGLIRIVDASTPTSPTFMKGGALTWPANGEIEQLFGRSPGEGIPLRVAVVGDTAYVATVPLGIQVVDLHTLKTRTDRRTPIVQQTVNIGGVPRDVTAVGDTVLAVSRQGLTVLNGAAFGERLGTLDLPNAFRVSAASGYRVLDPLTGAEQEKTLALVTAGSIVHVVDVTQPASPTMLGSLDLGEPLFSIIGIPGRRLAFAGNGFNTVYALDLTDPTHPTQIGTLKGEVAPRYLAADDQTLYVDATTNDEAAVQVWAEGRVKFLDPTDVQQEYDGGVTDGVTRLKVRVTGRVLEGQETVWLRLNDPETKNLGLGLGGLCPMGTPVDTPTSAHCQDPVLNVAVNRPPGQVAFAEALYQVPDVFIRAFLGDTQRAKDEQAAVRFADVAVYEATNSKELVSRVLKLKRPPVLLVHGIWSAGKDEDDAWKIFEPLLNVQHQFMTAKADYEETNAAGFATNAKRLPSFIDQALGEALAERLTVTKVDVVAHSMGGLITREYCLQKPDDCKRQIHKFITIDTPHTGTEIANEVIKVGLDPAERSCKETVISDGLHARNPPNRVDEGAVFDLAKDSQAIQRLALTPIIVPSHTIAGGTPLGAASTFPVPLTPDVIFSIPLFFAYDPDLAYLWTGLHIYCNRVPNREFLVGDQHTKVVFPDGGDDRLVPVVSQLGGLTGNGVSMPFTDVDHVTVHDRERVAREVIRLLEASPTGAAFQGTGFWGGLR